MQKEHLQIFRAHAKLVSTPLATHLKLSTANCSINEIEKGLMFVVPYESAIVAYLLHCRTQN